MFLTKKKPLLFAAKIRAILSQNSRLTANFRICERTRTRKSRGHQPYPRNQRAIEPLITHCQHKNSLHPSRRMAWEILRHGEAVFFPSGCRSQTPYSKKASEYKKILQISENNSVFILYIQNKAISLQCCSGQQNNNH